MLVAIEVLQQESTGGGRVDILTQSMISLAAALEPGQVNPLKACNDVIVVGRITHRGDINHNQTLNPLGVVQRKLHSGLAAHGVTHQVDALKLQLVQQFQQVVAHCRVVHLIAVR